MPKTSHLIDLMKAKGWLAPEDLKRRGWVQLHPDQNLPENPVGKEDQFYHVRLAYHNAQQEMVKDNWRKILPEEGK